MPLAEGPTIDGGTLALILGVLLFMFVGWCVCTVYGFRWAMGAARGSRADGVKWGVGIVVVLLPGLLAGPNVLLLPGLVVVGAQVFAFSRSRSGGPPAP